jgi:hypothetical protein
MYNIQKVEIMQMRDFELKIVQKKTEIQIEELYNRTDKQI